MAIPRDPEATLEANGLDQAQAAALNAGRELQVALDREAAVPARSPMNQGDFRGNTYARLVDRYADKLGESEFQGRVVAVVTAGASLSPRVNDEGKVELQTPETYIARYQAVSADAHVARSMDLARKPETRLESVLTAMRAPLARAFLASSPELTPDAVKANAASPMAQRHQGLNLVSPSGDARTGRPLITQVALEHEGGMTEIYGFEKGRGATKAFASIRETDHEGEPAYAVVTAVSMTAAASGDRSIVRSVDVTNPASVRFFPSATEKQRAALVPAMAAEGWRPITTPPHPRADLPAAARNLSARDFSSRGIMALAQAIDKGALSAGLAFARKPSDASVLEGMDALTDGAARDYANLVRRLEDTGLGAKGVDVILKSMEAPMKALASLRREVDTVRADATLQDPVTAMRLVADDLMKRTSADPAKVQAARRLFDEAVGTAKAAGLESPAADIERMKVLNNLAKNLTELLGAHIKDPATGETAYLHRAKADGTQERITFPDGTARFVTPFDAAITKGYQPYQKVAKAYEDLLRASLDAGSRLTAVQLLTTSTPTAPITGPEAQRLATQYINGLLHGPSKGLSETEHKQVEARLAARQGAPFRYIDEAVATHVFGPLVAAHREKLTPAEVQRELVARARDTEPSGLLAQSFRVYAYNAVKEAGDPGAFLVPEDPERTRWTEHRVGMEEGLPVFEVRKNGMSYQEMTERRQELSRAHTPVTVSRQPLPKGMPTTEGLATIFNKPVIVVPDPVDGVSRRAVVLGASVEAAAPGATDVVGGRYNAIVHRTGRMVPESTVKVQADEFAFRDAVNTAQAKALLGAKANPASLDALDRIGKGGAYRVALTPEGFDAFRAQRGAAIQAMAEVKIAKAQQELARGTKGLTPDQMTEATTRRDLGVSKAGAEMARASVEMDQWIERAQTFVRTHAGVEGYFSLEPPLGIGSGSATMRTAPLDFRFRDVQDFNERRASLGRLGLGIRYDLAYGGEA